jgi:hypothetical protein
MSTYSLFYKTDTLSSNSVLCRQGKKHIKYLRSDYQSYPHTPCSTRLTPSHPITTSFAGRGTCASAPPSNTSFAPSYPMPSSYPLIQYHPLIQQLRPLQAGELVPLPLLYPGDSSAFWIEILEVRAVECMFACVCVCECARICVCAYAHVLVCVHIFTLVILGTFCRSKRAQLASTLWLGVIERHTALSLLELVHCEICFLSTWLSGRCRPNVQPHRVSLFSLHCTLCSAVVY